MAQLSDDCFAFGGPLMTLEAAQDLLAERLTAVTGTESVALIDSLGRVLAGDVVSPVSVPPHDNSAVDGYAVRFEDLSREGDTVLPIVGRIAAGDGAGRPDPCGTAVRIFTGAPMPPGFDTVMMQEDCREQSGPGVLGSVLIQPGIKRGANLRKAGEDVMAGSVILPAGRRLRPQDVGLLAAVGSTAVTVRTPLRVAIISTGNELVEPGSPLAPGAIYDANRFTLSALIRQMGGRVTDFGILRDNPVELKQVLETAAKSHDLIVTTGGVSTGEEDHVKGAVEASGGLHFWRLAIKPGRPVALGQVRSVPFVGLPGNPVAAMITFFCLARPLIQLLGGETVTGPTLFRVRSDFDYKKKEGRREFVRVCLRRDPGGTLVATKFPRDGAGILSSMVGSDGLVVLSEEITRLESGSMVEYMPFTEVL
ncbi:molybdopterin molybdenumtransferase MoeA [Skermanella aerolata]|uniref:Molybdopterin molybdenumtransferase n=1 Tax=Skermanella aerolata TaxID=393310 RepID=A0A512DL60_9PROT|nr:gephyrin-like molybdotransferase Glp [Skermanella aerolata]KJB92353.1 molybdopterin biosynthesis protein MoeA [Skermanella aerolata KACC 11604]GEO37185.1 molybdopterin molybdenumtransferase MoeA [Skermanella aerolata]